MLGGDVSGRESTICAWSPTGVSLDAREHPSEKVDDLNRAGLLACDGGEGIGGRGGGGRTGDLAFFMNGACAGCGRGSWRGCRTGCGCVVNG